MRMCSKNGQNFIGKYFDVIIIFYALFFKLKIYILLHVQLLSLAWNGRLHVKQWHGKFCAKKIIKDSSLVAAFTILAPFVSLSAAGTTAFSGTITPFVPWWRSRTTPWTSATTTWIQVSEKKKKYGEFFKFSVVKTSNFSDVVPTFADLSKSVSNAWNCKSRNECIRPFRIDDNMLRENQSQAIVLRRLDGRQTNDYSVLLLHDRHLLHGETANSIVWTKKKNDRKAIQLAGKQYHTFM